MICWIRFRDNTIIMLTGVKCFVDAYFGVGPKKTRGFCRPLSKAEKKGVENCLLWTMNVEHIQFKLANNELHEQHTISPVRTSNTHSLIDKATSDIHCTGAHVTHCQKAKVPGITWLIFVRVTCFFRQSPFFLYTFKTAPSVCETTACSWKYSPLFVVWTNCSIQCVTLSYKSKTKMIGLLIEN